MKHLLSTQDLLSNKLRGGMWLFLAMACLIHQFRNSEEFFRRRHVNPEGFMTMPEMIQYWGYPSEEYEVLTDDGYYLQLNRIPHGKHCPHNKGPRPIVLLVHGFLCDGSNWITNLPSNSLGFFLADAGYDVWILNVRGTTWSRRHKEFSIYQQEFWEFSFHEMGIYDVPATVNFILQETRQDSLYYAAHSQGATIGFIALAVVPYFSEKVKLFLSFTPGYTLEGIRGTLHILGIIPEGLKTLIWGTKEFYLSTDMLKTIMTYACSYPLIDYLCLQAIFFSGGYNVKNINVSRSDVYLATFPDYTSVKNLDHWRQIMRSVEFKYFDYGPKNIEIYNMTKPPFYKIEDITVPVAVWSGGKDIATTKRDIESLLPRIPHLVFYKDIPDWEHLDVVWGLDAPQRFYPDVLELMQKYKDKNQCWNIGGGKPQHLSHLPVS